MNQTEETEINSKDKIGSERKTVGNYTEKQKIIINEYLKGKYSFKERMDIYGKYIRGNIIIREEPELNAESIPKQDREKSQKEIIYQRELIRRQKKVQKCLHLILLIVSVLICLGFIGFALYLFLSPTKHHPHFEKLVTGLTYKKNQIMKFQNIKTTKIDYEFGNIDASNETKKLIEYFDFIIGISSQDKVVEDNIEKEVFSGFVFLENYMIDNETEKMLMQNSSLFEESEKGQILRNLWGLRNMEEKKYFNFSINDIKLYCCIDNGTLPIMKFDFYRNGKISKIYKPKNLVTLFYDRMIEILEKVIPRIAEDDFNTTYNNISEALENEYEKIKSNPIEDEFSNDTLEEAEN